MRRLGAPAFEIDERAAHHLLTILGKGRIDGLCTSEGNRHGNLRQLLAKPRRERECHCMRTVAAEWRIGKQPVEHAQDEIAVTIKVSAHLHYRDATIGRASGRGRGCKYV